MTTRDLAHDIVQRLGAPIFPIRITIADGKAQKAPLTKRGHLDASRDPGVFDWTNANGVGITMGDGLYALDIDDPKPGLPPALWLRQNGLHPQDLPTRAHKTPSGGYHFLYRLPEEHRDLPTRQGIVKGLDSRGAGGWIAFGHGYTVQSERALAWLPVAVCKVIRDGYTGSMTTGGATVVLRTVAPVDEPATKMKLLRAKKACRTLRLRWNGHRPSAPDRTVDTSRSAMDHSLAFLLALSGFTYDETVWLLLNAFDHGACRDATRAPAVNIRAAHRSAAKAAAYVTDLEEKLGMTLRVEPGAVDAYLALIARGQMHGGTPR